MLYNSDLNNLSINIYIFAWASGEDNGASNLILVKLYERYTIVTIARLYTILFSKCFDVGRAILQYNLPQESYRLTKLQATTVEKEQRDTQ